MTSIGIISDTHSLLRNEAIEALEGADLIVHAGDIGSMDIVERLRTIAPVRAVRGNMDRGLWVRDIPVSDAFEISGKFLYLLHDLDTIDLDPRAAGIDVVISGHSHRPRIENKNGVLYVNPGSAGPRRFSLPISIAKLEIHKNEISAELQTLSVQ